MAVAEAPTQGRSLPPEPIMEARDGHQAVPGTSDLLEEVDSAEDSEDSEDSEAGPLVAAEPVAAGSSSFCIYLRSVTIHSAEISKG